MKKEVATKGLNKATVAIVGGIAPVTLAVIWAGTVTLSLYWLGLPVLLLLALAGAAVALQSRKLGFAAAGLAALLVLAIFAGSSVFQSERYRAQLGATAEGANALPALDLKKSGLVTPSAARKAAETLLSTDPGLGSQVEVGQLVKQLVAGEMVYVGLLEHKGFGRWLANKSTPGYAVVSAHDASKARLVLGRNIQLLDSGWMGNSIERQVWLKNPTLKVVDFTPELDDAGTPFWVVSVLDREQAFGPTQVEGVVLVNAETGEQQHYPLAKVPTWVDRAIPEFILVNQVNYWGALVHGFWNTIFGAKDILHAGATDLVYGQDGKAQWFVELTAAGKKSGINGFLMVDARTKQATHYTLAGADQESAIHAMEGLYPEKNFSMGNALPFMVGDTPTYVAPMYKGGVLRAFGLVSIKDYQIVAGGETLDAAVRAYMARLHRISGNADQANVSSSIKGVVERFAADVRQGATTYLLQLKGSKQIYVGASDVSQSLPLTKVGDTVDLTAEGSSGALVMTKFINQALD